MLLHLFLLLVGLVSRQGGGSRYYEDVKPRPGDRRYLEKISMEESLYFRKLQVEPGRHKRSVDVGGWDSKIIDLTFYFLRPKLELFLQR